MARIDRAMVEKIAGLAYLKLNEEEVEYYQNQLGRVLDYIEQLSAFDTSLPDDWRAELATFVSPEREDMAQPSTVVEKVLSAAPKVVGTAFQVPRIIE